MNARNVAHESSPLPRTRHTKDFLQTAAAIDGLFKEALEHEGSSAFYQFLDFARRLSNLSVFNTMLVKVQRPGASAVATVKKWASLGGQLRPRAIPIVILRPFGPIDFVYEYLDVYGVEVPGDDASSLFATGKLSAGTYDRVVTGAHRRRVSVRETNVYGGAMAGTAEALTHLPGVLAGSDDGALWNVMINARHDLPTRFSTLAHELGHIFCGHLGPDPKGRWREREQEGLSHIQRELEAESVCWLVSNRNGVSSRSPEYLHALMNKGDVQRVSIYAIYAAANLVEAR